MTEFRYEEPLYLAAGQKLYEQFPAQQSKGNAVSILSDAMTVLRQLGTAGLDLWIDSHSGEREFIRDAMKGEPAVRLGLAECLKSMRDRKNDHQTTTQGIDAAWNDIENLMRALRYAKYYAKTLEKQDGQKKHD